MSLKKYEKIFSTKYLYDGIQNIQFDINSPIVYLKDIGNRVYIDVKFSKSGKYKVYAEIDFNNNEYVQLQTGVFYPDFQRVSGKNKIQKTNQIYYLIGEIKILENQLLSQPIFIRNCILLENKINIKNIKIIGNNPIEYVYTEWFNTESNTGKRPYQHANHVVSNSIFDNVENPRHMYKEMIVLKWHMHTYCTAINGPSTYMGIDFSEGRIVFSVWNANKDNIDIQNDIISVGENVESNKFDHEGNGSYFTLRYNKYNKVPLSLNHKYGFYIRYDEQNNNTIYSAYFINLGPVNLPYENPQWIFIGNVIHYNKYIIENRIGGFLENYMTANGHLYQRSVAIGNGWVSKDGKEWIPSNHEEAVMDDLTNQQASTYEQDGFITYNIGGRKGMNDENLKKHGNLRTFDLYRNIKSENVPPHLLNILIKL